MTPVAQTKAMFFLCLLSVSLAAKFLNLDNIHHQWKAKRVLEGYGEATEFSLAVNGGFYPFDFGATGTEVEVKFKVKPEEMTVISAWDCYCPGDAFEILLNGKVASELKGDCLSVPDGQCDAKNDLVIHPLQCAREALSGQSKYCYARTLVSEPAEVTVRVKRSIVGAGTGYLRADKACQVQPGQWVACCLLDETCNVAINYQ